MTAITVERVARKRHTCGRCRGVIRPGVHYAEWSFPPGCDQWSIFGNANTRWVREYVHLTYVECLTRPCESECPLSPDGAPWPCCVCLAPEPGDPS